MRCPRCDADMGSGFPSIGEEGWAAIISFWCTGCNSYVVDSYNDDGTVETEWFDARENKDGR